VNAKAHRARNPDPALDTHGRRILCGALGATCARVIAWDRQSKQPVVAIPSGLTDDGTPGVYRRTGHSREKVEAGRMHDVRRDDRPPGWSASHWRDAGPVRFARVPCVIPCPRGHLNDVTTAVLDT
jgi:hypothetical protein